jgi:lysophospholipase L1-like esterase
MAGSIQADVPLVPCVMATLVGQEELLLGDRTHANADGARVTSDAIWPSR